MITRRSVLLLTSLFAAFASPAVAAPPREELLRLVPNDVGFCIVIEDLRGHTAQLLQSPLVTQFRKSAMGAMLDSDRDWQKLAEGQKQLEALLGLDWTKLRDDILGDAVVFAFRPGPPGKPNEDRDLLLVRAREPQALAKLVERVNLFQIGSRDVKAIEPLEHKGQRFFHRVDAKGASFYALEGPILVISSQEAMLRAALDRMPAAEGEDESAIGRQLRSLLGPEKRLASLWLNPRAFDASIAAKVEQASDEQAAVIKNLLVYWKAVEGVAIGVGIHDHMECMLAVRARTNGLSPAAQRFFAEAAKPSELWQRFPDDAMLAVAGRFDSSAFAEMIGEFLTPQARQTLHDSLDRFVGATLDKDVIKEVLPCFGPDLGLCVMAPPDDQKSWVPRAVFALRVRPGDKRPFIDQSVLSTMTGLAQAVVIDHNSKHDDRLSLKTEIWDKGEVKYLSNPKRFPHGLRPAFALRDGYLMLATSPEAMRLLAKPPSGEASAEVPLMRVSLKELRRYLLTHRKALAVVLAEQNKAKPEEVENHLEGLTHALQLLDRLEISQRTGDGQAALTLRLMTSQPLRK
jgi:hypothetical protein